MSVLIAVMSLRICGSEHCVRYMLHGLFWVDHSCTLLESFLFSICAIRYPHLPWFVRMWLRGPNSIEQRNQGCSIIGSSLITSSRIKVD